MEHSMAEDMDAMLESIVARQKRENARYQREVDARVRKARRFIQSVPAALLRLDPALRRIVLFGSLASGAVNRLGFDIDLAVDSDRYLRIVDWSLDQPWRIDVIDLSAIDEAFIHEIENKGKMLYEAKR